MFDAPAHVPGLAEVRIVTSDGHVSNSVDLEYVREKAYAAVKFRNVEHQHPGTSTAITDCHDSVLVATGAEGRKGGGFSVFQYSLSEDYKKLTLVKELAAIRLATYNGCHLDTVLGLACDPWGTSEDYDL